MPLKAFYVIICLKFIPVIICATCNDFPALPHAEIIEIGNRKPPFKIGDKVSFSCITGYSSGAFIEAQCNLVSSIPTWTFPDYHCKLVDCGAPHEVEFAVYTGKAFTYGKSITYSCKQGYELVGHATRTCNDYGEWEPRYPPYCKVLTCPELIFPTHGYVRDYGKSYDTVAEYSCDQGYRLEGNKHRKCQLDKTWTGEEPECVEVKCLSPGAIENGRVKNMKKEFKSGDVIIFVCNNNRRSWSSKCQDNGEWSRRPPLCDDTEEENTTLSNVVTTPMPIKTTSEEPNYEDMTKDIVLFCIFVSLHDRIYNLILDFIFFY